LATLRPSCGQLGGVYLLADRNNDIVTGYLYGLAGGHRGGTAGAVGLAGLHDVEEDGPDFAFVVTQDFLGGDHVVEADAFFLGSFYLGLVGRHVEAGTAVCYGYILAHAEGGAGCVYGYVAATEDQDALSELRRPLPGKQVQVFVAGVHALKVSPGMPGSLSPSARLWPSSGRRAWP
jgi:hypothetical protein